MQKSLLEQHVLVEALGSQGSHWERTLPLRS